MPDSEIAYTQIEKLVKRFKNITAIERRRMKRLRWWKGRYRKTFSWLLLSEENYYLSGLQY